MLINFVRCGCRGAVRLLYCSDKVMDVRLINCVPTKTVECVPVFTITDAIGGVQWWRGDFCADATPAGFVTAAL